MACTRVRQVLHDDDPAGHDRRADWRTGGEQRGEEEPCRVGGWVVGLTMQTRCPSLSMHWACGAWWLPSSRPVCHPIAYIQPTHHSTKELMD